MMIKKTLLTLLVLGLSAQANNPFILNDAEAGISEPTEGSEAFFAAEADRQLMRRAVRAAQLGDDMFVVTLANVPQYITIMNDFVMNDSVHLSINYYALTEWIIHTMGIAKSPDDLKVIKPYLKKVMQEQPQLNTYASKLLAGPFAQSEEEIFAISAPQRAAFLKMFQ